MDLRASPSRARVVESRAVSLPCRLDLELREIRLGCLRAAQLAIQLFDPAAYFASGFLTRDERGRGDDRVAFGQLLLGFLETPLHRDGPAAARARERISRARDSVVHLP